MRIRKIATASSLLVILALTSATPTTTLAQQVDDANAGTVQADFLRLGVITGGEMGVPEDEHLETWVSRALSIYAQTDDESRVKQREEIAKGLNTIFELRHQQRVKELRELEARVQKLKSTLNQRAASKSEIVKKRLDYLIREADGLGWGDGIPAPKRSGLTGAGFSTETLLEQPGSRVSGEEATAPKTDPL